MVQQLFARLYDPMRLIARIAGMNGLALAHHCAPPGQSALGGWCATMTVEQHDLSAERLIDMIATRSDRTAFTALFTRFAPRVKAYLLQRGLDAAGAEELAQEVLLIVWR